MRRRTCCFIVVVLLLSACDIQTNNEVESEEEPPGNPTAEEILSSSPDADIFKAGGIIYSNAEDIDWVMEEELTLDEEVLEITEQSNHGEDFENGTATELPVGTKIYDHHEGRGPIYTAVVDDKEIRYLGLIEG
ncbi:hypothetical protein [Alkalicoccus chagannorensis]|uniref:hypothetical protein n=1 Tax=Alkalicoccus chagannorensis TaxID=427072 RepID=UPI0003F67C50|nr:hypothetical protein [Alkalicoccus chagannorensis]